MRSLGLAVTLVTTATLGVGSALAAATTPAAAAPLAGTAGGYHQLSPTRYLDTRVGNGAPTGPVGTAETISFQVLGRGSVPAAGVAAVVFNLTAVSPTQGTFVTAYPSSTALPMVSSINVPAGRTRANLVTVPVGTNGQVSLYNSQGQVDLLADVVGYYDTDGSAGGFRPESSPYRLLDTRQPGDGPAFGPYEGFDLSVNYGADANPHITALALNITAINPSAGGFVTVWDGVSDPPNASTLNFVPGDVVPNAAVIPVRQSATSQGMLPTFAVVNFSEGTVDIAIDVVGIYQDGAAPDDLRYGAIAPVRVLDTRTGLGGASKFGTGHTQSLAVPSALGVADTQAFTGNLTVVDPSQGTFLTLWPAGQPLPLASNLNADAGVTAANAVTVPSQYQIYNASGGAHVLVDVSGRFQLHQNSTSSNRASARGATSADTWTATTGPRELRRH